MKARPRPAGALAIVVAVALVLGPTTAATAETDYPTWSEVQQAKRNESAKRAQISAIEKLIAGLDLQAADFSRAALEAAENYNQAASALAAASTRADKLDGQSDAASARAAESKQQAALIVAHLARHGSGTLTLDLLFGRDDPDQLLYKLGAMSALSEQTTLVYEKAQADERTAAALTAQATVARDKLAALEKTAKKAYADAQLAAAAAQSRASQQDVAAEQLYAQLASLKGTTSALEQAYLDGLAWEKAQEEIKDPPQPPPPVNPTPEPPSENVVSGAIAFARAQLGDAYKLNGAGPDVWDCSGLTMKSYSSVGVYIGTHSATNQYATMKAAQRLVPYDQIVAGDLLFYSSGGSTTATKYHVTLYIGGGQMIEAPYPGAPVRIKPVRFGDLVPYAGRPTP
jgi:cell wall-associated NlpC family hydrolase